MSLQGDVAPIKCFFLFIDLFVGISVKPLQQQVTETWYGFSEGCLAKANMKSLPCFWSCFSMKNGLVNMSIWCYYVLTHIVTEINSQALAEDFRFRSATHQWQSHRSAYFFLLYPRTHLPVLLLLHRSRTYRYVLVCSLSTCLRCVPMQPTLMSAVRGDRPAGLSIVENSWCCFNESQP